MSYGIVHHFVGGTKANYEASIAAVHPGPGLLPKGQIYHAAGASPGGWTIIAVHESRQSWEQFRDQILMPRMQKGISGGFAAPPQETVIELDAADANIFGSPTSSSDRRTTGAPNSPYRPDASPGSSPGRSLPANIEVL